MSNFLTELADMFPSWDAEALRAVHEANRGDQEKTITQLLAWTAEDAPSSAQQPAAAFPVVCPPGAGPGTQLLVHAPTTGQQMTVVVPNGIGPGLQFLVALPPQFARATPAPQPPAPPQIHDAAPVVLERAFYDDIMARRITDKMAPKATGALLKATAKFKQLARKARAEVARRPHVRRLPSSQDAHAIRDATREDKIAAGKALLGQRLAFLALRMVEMEDDGNCQFRALAQQVFGDDVKYHAGVRKAIVERMRADEAFFGAMFDGADELDAYLATMAMPRTWGDELTLRAAADAFGVSVHVITSTETNWYLRYDPSDGSTPKAHAFLTYVSPVHYDAVAG